MIAYGPDKNVSIRTWANEPAGQLDWLPVVDAMAVAAEQANDFVLFEVAQMAHSSVHDHNVYATGCEQCDAGTVDRCPAWASTQRILHAWLIQRAGL